MATEGKRWPTKFFGGQAGSWRVNRIDSVRGPTLQRVPRLEVAEGPDAAAPAKVAWVLQGIGSFERYVTRSERSLLQSRSPPLGRPQATEAALIPISKSETWWELTQEERRAIFEERSHHIATGLEYLPAIARRLYHSRELGEPFDFLTWFEYAPEHRPAFRELLGRLRASEEWRFVIREVEVKLTRLPGAVRPN